ncbi:hypothetical protein ACN60_16865 [Escherichia coli]|nr:hypothetical protein ACN60_16865 [Escherichia coli]
MNSFLLSNSRNEEMMGDGCDDVAAGRRRLHIKAVCQSVREATTASGVDNAASPRLADTAERDYFTLRERLITMQKQLEGTQKYINEQCR